MSAAAAAPRVAGGRSPSIGGRDGGGGAYAGLAMSFQFKGRVPRSRRWGPARGRELPGSPAPRPSAAPAASISSRLRAIPRPSSETSGTRLSLAAPAVSMETAPTSVEVQSIDWEDQWYPIHLTDDLDTGAPNAFTLLGKGIVIWLDATVQWRCHRDRCPHRLVPLSEGRVNEAGHLECAYHGWEFNAEGQCVAVPQARDKEQETRACSSRRACLENYPCAVRQGLLFVKPRVMRPGEDPREEDIPIVTEIEENREEWTMGSAVRDLPYDFTTLLENVLDVSHVPFTHHGTVSNRKNACPVDLQVSDESILGFRGVWPLGPRNGYYGPQTTRFAPPNLMVHGLWCYDKRGFDTLTVVYAVPIAPGRCRVISRFPFRFKSSLPRTLFPLIPGWIAHPGANTTLEDDQIFLHKGEREMVQEYIAKRPAGADTLEDVRDASGGVLLGKICYIPTTADNFVLAFRRWLDRHAGGGPFGPFDRAFARAIGPEKTMEELLDRYHSHTIICKSCSGALRNFTRLESALKTAAVALGILAGVVAAVAVSGAQTGSGFVVPGIPAGAGPVAHVLHAAGVALIKATQVVVPLSAPPSFIMLRAGVLAGLALACRMASVAVKRFTRRFISGDRTPPRNDTSFRSDPKRVRLRL